MAGDAEKRSMGGAVRLYLLLRLFLESAHKRAVSYRRGSWRALPPPDADATSAVPAWSILGCHHQQTADLSSGTRISTRRLVLFPRRLCAEIAARISGFTDSLVSSCTKPKWLRLKSVGVLPSDVRLH